MIYSTDNGAETVSWPDGGITPFKGEKGTTWEGGFRIPLAVRWPGVIAPGRKINDIISHEDWFPTFAAAMGDDTVVEDLKAGKTMNGKDWKVHLDGYNMLPFFKGDAKKGPREEIFYFDQAGNLNAVRVQDWKVHFATNEGDITTAYRETPAWPTVINLKADPYETAWEESKMYLRWYAENTMWIFVPVQAKVKEFFSTFADFPFQAGSSLSVANVGYHTLRNADLIKRLQDVESYMPANRQ